MLDRRVNAQEAAQVLDLESTAALEDAVAGGLLTPVKTVRKGRAFTLGELLIYKLATVIRSVGVDAEKARRYAQAVLNERVTANEDNLVDWVENEAQELFCLICDNQLARIYLRNKDDGREIDVGAVKPVLLPITRCEVNVFRAIRPVVVKARHVLTTQ